MNNHLYLAHHGIKGQKWGVRRFQNKDGTRTAAGKKRYNIDDHRVLESSITTNTKNGKAVELSSIPSTRIANFLAAHNRKIRADAENTQNYKIKADGKPVGEMTLYKESKDSLNVTWVGIDDSERGHGYATAAMIGALEVAKRSGCKHVTLEVPGDSPDARHIYEKLGFVPLEQISSSGDVWGGLTAMRLDLQGDVSVKHSGTGEFKMDYLAHHGIKGQKWGVRRFQNKDGTRTAAGKSRYYDDKGKKTSEGKILEEQTKNQKNAISGAQSVVSGAQKISNISGEQPRNRYNTRKVLTQEEMDQMSNKELQELVTRMNLEQQYSSLTQDKVSRSKVDTGLRYADAVLSIVGGALTIAVAYKTLRG